MRTILFVGPTVSAADVRAALPEADLRGPVACGDVLRAARGAPGTIAIIDGLFEHTLPVWHKEILWALSQGWRVHGASSMGALRAVELARFGMVGVGEIFAWYRDGVLEDEDEVAVAHEDAERAYRARSDAMVNVRATLARAVAAGALDAEAAATLAATVKATPYPQRDLRRAVEASARAGLSGSTRDGLRAWLDEHGVFDQKRADALALLALLALLARDEPDAARQEERFDFSYTETFHELVRSVDRAPPPTSSPGFVAQPQPSMPPPPSTPQQPPVTGDDLFEELQLCGPLRFHECWKAALETSLARAGSAEPARRAALAELPAVLAAHGLLASLAARADEKSRLLAAEVHPAIRSGATELIAWHFSRLELPAPDDVDRYARSMGFESRDDLVLAIAREQWYLDRTSSRGEP